MLLLTENPKIISKVYCVHIYCRIVPETGGVDGIHVIQPYSSHQRKYTASELKQSYIIDQPLFTTREEHIRDPYKSFRDLDYSKSFVSKPKQKKNNKKRSRNKGSYIGMTSNQNRYTSKFIKNSMNEGNISLSYIVTANVKKPIYTPSKRNISFVVDGSLDGRKSMNQLIKAKNKKSNNPLTARDNNNVSYGGMKKSASQYMVICFINMIKDKTDSVRSTSNNRTSFRDSTVGNKTKESLGSRNSYKMLRAASQLNQMVDVKQRSSDKNFKHSLSKILIV